MNWDAIGAVGEVAGAVGVIAAEQSTRLLMVTTGYGVDNNN